MEQRFKGLWEKGKQQLLNDIKNTTQESLEKNSEYNGYYGLMKLVVKDILNHEEKRVSEDIATICFTNYRGTFFFVFAEYTYEPLSTQTYYTMVEYGSCSGCDTYLGIESDFGVGLINEEERAKQLLSLCLDLFQNIHAFKEII